MRPVNLLPDDLRPRQGTGQLRGSSYAVVGVLGALLLMVVVYVLSANQVNSRTSEIATVEQEKAQADAQAARLAPYQAFAQIKATRIESVKSLASRRFDWERLMREVALVLPAETSLTDLSASTSGQAVDGAPAATDPTAAAAATPSLNLKGCSKRQPDVATLMVRLRRLYRATDVQLTESTKQNTGGGATPVDSGGSEGCPLDTYQFDVTVSFSAVELQQDKSVPARLGRWSMNVTERDRKILMLIVPVVLVVAYWFLLLSPKREEASKLGDELAQAETARDDAVARAQSVAGARGSFASDFAEVLRVGKAIPTTVDMPALLVQLDKASEGTGISFQSLKAGQRTEAQPAPPAAAPTGGSQPTGAGGEPAQTPVGQAAEAANESSDTSDQANAAAGADAGAAAGAGAATPGLDTVPLDFTFEGDFFELTNFFHKLKRFVHLRGDRIVVGGRLMTIDSFTLTMGENFPTLTAEMTATVYLSPLSEGTTAGATPAGPGTAAADGSQPAGDAAAPAPTSPTSTPPQ